MSWEGAPHGPQQAGEVNNGGREEPEEGFCQRPEGLQGEPLLVAEDGRECGGLHETFGDLFQRRVSVAMELNAEPPEPERDGAHSDIRRCGPQTDDGKQHSPENLDEEIYSGVEVDVMMCEGEKR